MTTDRLDSEGHSPYAVERAGTMNIDHLKGNIGTTSRPLPADTYAEAKRRLDGVATDW